MKANRGQIERALDTAAPDYRFFLLYGPDESASRDLAARIGKGLGADAERIDLSGAMLKGDPARLADEAASISLFGGRRHIRVEPAGDEAMEAIEALLESAGAANPVVIIAGALRKDAKLVKLAMADPRALAFASYMPDEKDAGPLATAIARDHGLRLRPDVARRLAAATGGDRALLARELEKLALYVDAAPDRPRDIDHDALDALGAATEEGDLSRLVNAVLDGNGPDSDAEIARLATEGIEGIPLIRALSRRLLLLAQIKAEGGAMAPSAKSLFFKEKEAVLRQVSRWNTAAIDSAILRLAAAERAVKAARGIGPIAADAELLAIGRAAARMR